MLQTVIHFIIKRDDHLQVQHSMNPDRHLREESLDFFRIMQERAQYNIGRNIHLNRECLLDTLQERHM